MANKVPFSRVPQTQLKDKPDQRWSSAVIQGLNESMLALSGGPQNIELKSVDVVTPDPWHSVTFDDPVDPPGPTGPPPPWTGTARYMRHYDGSVQLVAQVDGGVAGNTMFSLGLDMAPAYGIVFSAYSTGTGVVQAVSISVSNGSVIPMTGTGPWFIHVRYMPNNNRMYPLSCFPINVKTKFKQPPKSVVCLKNQRVGQVETKVTCTAMLPSWRFIQSPQGPVVQIIDIPGLEYGCRQRVSIAIIGG